MLSERFLPSLRHLVSGGFSRVFFVLSSAPLVRFRAMHRHYDPDSLRWNSAAIRFRMRTRL